MTWNRFFFFLEIKSLEKEDYSHIGELKFHLHFVSLCKAMNSIISVSYFHFLCTMTTIHKIILLLCGLSHMSFSFLSFLIVPNGVPYDRQSVYTSGSSQPQMHILSDQGSCLIDGFFYALFVDPDLLSYKKLTTTYM